LTSVYFYAEMQAKIRTTNNGSFHVQKSTGQIRIYDRFHKEIRKLQTFFNTFFSIWKSCMKTIINPNLSSRFLHVKTSIICRPNFCLHFCIEVRRLMKSVIHDFVLHYFNVFPSVISEPVSVIFLCYQYPRIE
jgi:hypothetical protein